MIVKLHNEFISHKCVPFIVMLPIGPSKEKLYSARFDVCADLFPIEKFVVIPNVLSCLSTRGLCGFVCVCVCEVGCFVFLRGCSSVLIYPNVKLLLSHII